MSVLEKTNWFYQPKSLEELQNRIDEIQPPETKAIVWKMVCETWNLCAFLIEQSEPDEEIALTNTLIEAEQEYLDKLSAEFTKWCGVWNWSPMSADDLLAEFREDMSDYEISYLNNFVERWEQCQSKIDTLQRDKPSWLGELK